MLLVCPGRPLSKTRGQLESVCARVHTCAQVRRGERRGERERIAINFNTAVMGNEITPFSSTN